MPNKSTFGPDDIAGLDGHVFVGWQNGVGTMGQPDPTTDNGHSLVVEYGKTGKCSASGASRARSTG